MRTTFIATTTAALLAAGVAGAQTTITFQDQGPEREPFNEEAIRLFEEANPDIDVEYAWQANEPYKTGIKVMMESNDPPDVYFVWAGSFANDIADTGVVSEISDSETRGDAWTRGASKGIVDQFRHNDGLYGVPAEIYTKTMWKNDAFFDDNGLEVPETLDELRTLCGRIREVDPLMVPISFGASESWTINHYLTILFQRHVPIETALADYQLQAPADELFTHPGYEKALEDFVSLIDAQCFNDGINSVTPEVGRTMFATELAAMNFCGSWCPPMFDDQGFAGRYSMFPFPRIEGAEGDQDGVLVGAVGYQVSEASDEREAALKFVSHLLSPEMAALRARMIGRIPSNNAALEDGDLAPMAAALLDMATSAPVSVPPLNTIVETSVSDVILKSGQDLVAGTITPAEFMDRVRAQARDAASRG
ncbi:ABC transporter substrate-binding protein [Jannaschia sp. LMIT008]|uniref:ABC transporter substrate-binding protein n=1 Tax=Jannaschia maritima TaxID=3032585 RepID=UPI002810D125|nr:extracellular solute-binding protein [Jannaschia sp. LMIT008]